MKNLGTFLLALMLISCVNTQNKKSDFPVLAGDYLGQTPPGDSAVLFAPGIVSTGIMERDLAITPDGNEIFFTRSFGQYKYSVIYHTKRINNVWQKPAVFEYSKDTRYKYTEPFVSCDGKKLLFVSNQPTHGAEKASFDIWVCEKDENNSWKKPFNLGMPINTEQNEYFPTMTADGTIYYNHFDPEKQDEFIYRSKLVDGKYAAPEKLNEKINGGQARFNAMIAPDESFIIIPTYGYPDSYGATDYYIVFRDKNDNWSNPINMGDQVNSQDGQEWSASLSADGKYLFFMSARIPSQNNIAEFNDEAINRFHNSYQNGNSDIYWISSTVIEKLREKAVF